MNNHLKVEGHNNLVRDRRTGVILNTNKTEIENARKRNKVRLKGIDTIGGAELPPPPPPPQEVITKIIDKKYNFFI